ncbi:MFS transporter [Apiospora aurea]|uniref:MFS transporter n=1 Tax=Apiospora aurea TaxID=335848 RepID=A0ABR1QVT5_9PEZI
MSICESPEEIASPAEMAQEQDKPTPPANGLTAQIDYAGSQAKTDPDEIRLVRKLDIWIMPVLWLMYFFNNIDRSSLAQARLNHLERDLDMQGTNFNTAVSILVVGYILMQVPSNMLLTRIQPSTYLAAVMLIWSVLSGMKTPNHATLTGLGFANLIAVGIFSGLDGKRGTEGWRWHSICPHGSVLLLALAQHPQTTWWLSEKERRLEGERMRRDRLDEAKDTETVWIAVRHAISDKRTWLFCALAHIAQTPLSFNYFLPTFHERTWHLTGCFSVSGIGFAAAAATLSPAGRYVACFIFPLGGYSATALIFSWSASTLSQSPEKKAVVVAMLNVGSSIGTIYGPYLWPSWNGPRYVMGFAASAAACVAAVALCWVMRLLLKRENERIRRVVGAGTVTTLYEY